MTVRLPGGGRKCLRSSGIPDAKYRGAIAWLQHNKQNEASEWKIEYNEQGDNNNNLSPPAILHMHVLGSASHVFLAALELVLLCWDMARPFHRTWKCGD